jgi:hypothetical protein
MKVLHCLFSLEVMVYEKMKILHITLFIGGCGFLKQQGKIGTKIGWQGGAHLKQGIDEPCNNVVSCKTTTTPPF